MALWNDGGLPNGSRKVKLYDPQGASDASGCTNWSGGLLKGVYILEDFNPTQPQTVQERRDETGAPNGQFGQDGFKTGSATVQIPNMAAEIVKTGWAFQTVQRGANGASEAYVVSEAGEPESQGQIRKQPVSLRKLVATPSGNLPPMTTFP